MTPIMRQILTGGTLPKNGLAAWYKFNEPVGSQVIYDYSGNNGNLVVGSAAGADTNDPTLDGVKAVFNTDDYAVKAIAPAPKNNDLTIIVVAKTTSNGADKGWVNYIDIANKRGWAFYTTPTAGVIRFTYYNSGRTEENVVSGGGVLNATDIAVFGVIKSGTGLSLLKNTSVVAAATATDGVIGYPAGSLSLFFAASLYYPCYLNCEMYQCLIYGRALSLPEYAKAVKQLRKDVSARGVIVA